MNHSVLTDFVVLLADMRLFIYFLFQFSPVNKSDERFVVRGRMNKVNIYIYLNKC